MINTIDTWFSDAPWHEEQHKRSHGKFATMQGPGAQAKQSKPIRSQTISGGKLRPRSKPEHTQTRHPSAASRIATWMKQKGGGTASSVAASASRLAQHAKQEARETGHELFGSKGEEAQLTKGLGDPNSPMRVKVGKLLSQNVPKVILDSLKHDVHNWKSAGVTLHNMAAGLPLSDSDVKSLKFLARKAVIGTVKFATGVHLVPGLGPLLEHAVGHASEYIVSQFAEHVADHAIDEHGTRFASMAGRAAGRRALHGEYAMAGGDDHAYFADAGPSDEEIEQLILDFLKTLGESVTTAPIDMKEIAAQAQNGDRASPMFGGIGGNALLRDEGTSAGARKGWQSRKSGGSQLRKTPPPAPPAAKPSYEEMRAHRLDIPEPPPRTPKPPPKKGTQSPRPVTAAMKRELPHQRITTQSQQYLGQRRSEKTRGTASIGGHQLRQNVSMGQREREGPAAEARESAARAHRAELSELTRRQKAGETLSEKEQHRKNILTRIHGAGESQPVGTAQPRSPSKWIPPRLRRRK